MTIYTKTGDNGTTSLFGGKRISKSDPQIHASGSIDELSSVIGLLLAKEKDKNKKELFLDIQKDLYEIMSIISGAQVEVTSLLKKITLYEEEINKLESQLPVLNQFILPGGNETAALMHVARTICRRAERYTVSYFETALKNETIESYRLIILQYLNRLSDLFFVLAREANKDKEITI